MISSKQEDTLMSELFDVEHELIESFDHLIDVQWDSTTMKLKIEKLMREYDTLNKELYDCRSKSDKY